MKKSLLFLALIFIGSLAYSQSHSRYQEDITGLWQSVTIFEEESESIDTFIILNFRDRYGIVCTSYEHFGVTEFERNGNRITFTMLNTLSKEDIYILNYQCRIQDEDEMTCEFENQKGEIVDRIVWTRIKKY